MTVYGNDQKTPLAQSLQKLSRAKAQDAIASLGKGLPCTVAKVISPGIVVVNFEVTSVPSALPQMEMPVGKPPYIQYPIQIGDVGVAISADVLTGALSGLGLGTPNITDTVGNLSAMTFFWLGKLSEQFIDPAAVSLIEPTGNCNFQVSPTGATVGGPNGNLIVEGNLSAGNGITCSFTTLTGQVVQIIGGIVTGLSS